MRKFKRPKYMEKQTVFLDLNTQHSKDVISHQIDM